LGALPARFRRERLLIVGCGDVGMRVVRKLGGRLGVYALTSSSERISTLRQSGVKPLLGNLDDASTLARLAGIATRIIHLAPPPAEGQRDSRTAALNTVLRLRTVPKSMVYGSTSGVYGDCRAGIACESRAVKPHTPRAIRRVDAEQRVRHLGRATGVRTSILRIPGIYASDREGGTPEARLRKGTPVLQASDDVYTNHIHADDLARACVRAMWRGLPQRVVNVNDDTVLKMGDYFDLAADLYDLPRPPRVPLAQAQDQLPLMLLSFMRESRRMDNSRMKRELKLKLNYPTVADGLGAKLR
jgi:nucleoside-diphosphate-sugar epimerase